MFSIIIKTVKKNSNSKNGNLDQSVSSRWKPEQRAKKQKTAASDEVEKPSIYSMPANRVKRQYQKTV